MSDEANSVVMHYGIKVGVRKLPLLRRGKFITKFCPSIEVNEEMYCMSDVDSVSGLVEADTRKAAFKLGKEMLQALPFWDVVRRSSTDLDHGIDSEAMAA